MIEGRKINFKIELGCKVAYMIKCSIGQDSSISYADWPGDLS